MNRNNGGRGASTLEENEDWDDTPQVSKPVTKPVPSNSSWGGSQNGDESRQTRFGGGDKILYTKQQLTNIRDSIGSEREQKNDFGDTTRKEFGSRNNTGVFSGGNQFGANRARTNAEPNADSGNNHVANGNQFNGSGNRYGNRDNNDQAGARPGFGNRDNNDQAGARPGFGNRDNNDQGGARPRFGNRDNNDQGGARPGFGNRDNNDQGGARPGFGNRDNNDQGGARPGFGNRDNNDQGGARPGFGNRDNNDQGGARPGFGNRDNNDQGGGRQGFGNRDNNDQGGARPGFGNRDNNDQGGARPGFGNRDNNDQGGARQGFGNRDNNDQGGARPGFGNRDNNDQGGGNSFGSRGGTGFGNSNRFAPKNDNTDNAGADSNPRFGGGRFGSNQDANNDGAAAGRSRFAPKNDNPDNAGAGSNPRFGGGRFGNNQDANNDGGNQRSGFGGERPNFRGNDAGRDFGDGERKQREPETYHDTGPSHVMKPRPIEEVFEEDVKVSENYMAIREEDEDVTLSPSPETVVIVEKWEEANLDPKVMVNIERAKYCLPRKIQSYAIPLILDGYDVKGHAETGSGKTAAFLLPIIQNIIKKKEAEEWKSARSKPFALIIEPTRELAIQLHDQARKLANGTGVSVSVAYGKFKKHDNLKYISTEGCDILVGTPGRLKDFIGGRYILMENLKYLVLDEADQLLEDEFMRDLRDISEADKFPKKEDRQTLLFSATFPPEVQRWADEWLREQNIMISNKKPTSANTKVAQSFVQVTESQKKEKLLELLKAELEKAKAEKGEDVAEDDVKLRRTLVFVKLKRACDVISSFLSLQKIKATTINGDRPQNLREEALKQFRDYEMQVVVATDVCARGIDIKDLDHVINMDLPDNYVTYVHRIGRTGRLKEGASTSFFDPLENYDMALAKDLVKGMQDANQEVPEFLQQAADGTLQFEKPADDDQAWSASAFGSGTGGAFGRSAATAEVAAPGAGETSEGITPAKIAAAAVEDNDDW
ncbi:DEAD/DEAH box helicase domain-containing protein [Ditylenchus destructor]|nr:DEAD/DEAH box helicase domain-containing protein [Ditylenchus destructor]